MDDFDRDVYSLFGLPFDAVSMAQAVQRVRAAAERRQPCFLSTPNLNFLIACQSDAAFRDSVIHSDLSVADGMPLVWLARLLGTPIRERVTGSGLFESLLDGSADGGEPMSVYFFGGQQGVSGQACQAINAESRGLRCVGFDCPGFGSVEEMSGDEAIGRINASGADFLVVSLGAKKGQAWIERNRGRISVPVISHLGAVVNFAAGTVSRAPVWMQRIGLEWLWRIKEEPALWRRYWQDGRALLAIVFSRLLPHLFWLRLVSAGQTGVGAVRLELNDDHCGVMIAGTITDPVSVELRQALRDAAAQRKAVLVDCSAAARFSPGLLGLLLMLRKRQQACGKPLRFVGVSSRLRRFFRWSGVEYLLD
ncbi:MAG: WecB/TagA/CpsF family glycosyltransferase [Hydrogenophilaceae bacterium]|nr:WecB/TagA/CpsF family glycosyltransferase [Hydrogenophilaceae bacterium]